MSEYESFATFGSGHRTRKAKPRDGQPALAMIASVAKLKSKLTEKGATRPSAIMRKKMPNGSSELQEMPRRREYAEGAEGEAEWWNDVEKS